MISMASKGLLAMLLLMLSCCISTILPLKAQNLSTNYSHAQAQAQHKFEYNQWMQLGGLLGNELVSAGRSMTTTGSGSPSTDEADPGYTHVAGYQSRGVYNASWHGVRSKMTIWKIQDVPDQAVSSAYIAAINTYNGAEMICAGVHVYPKMYNNKDLRFFTYWRSAKESMNVKSCYNTLCPGPGFVIANGSNLLPGQALSPLSEYGGEARYITLRIKKDEKTGDWSLYREDQGGPIGGMTLLGWWPQGLFKSLSDEANVIEWIGEVSYQKNERGPPMGNGHLPKEQGGRAASFYDMFGFNDDGTIYREFYKPIVYIDKPECYDMSYWYDSGKPYYQHFYYGGPAGCTT